MTFAQPIFLATLGLLLPLLIAYLVRRRRNLVRVPSTLRWRVVAVSKHRNKRFRFLSRLLSLLALVAAIWALAFAAAQPMLRGDGETLAIVIDVSASMGDRDAGPLAEALESAEDLIASRSPRDRIVVIAAGSRPSRLAGPTRESGVLSRALDAVVAERGMADVPRALELASSLLAAEEDARIVLLHDGATDLTAQRLEVPTGERRFGVGRDNLGVTTFAARPARDAHSDDDREILVGVTAAGESARRARVWIEAEGVVIGEEVVDIAGGTEQELRFRSQLPVRQLEARVAALDDVADAIASDDVATLDLGARITPAVRIEEPADVEGPSRFFAERALRAAGIDAFLDDENAASVVVTLGAPSRRPDRPQLILGGRGEGRWPVDVEALGVLEGEAASFRSLEPNHPVTRGVDLDGVTIVRATAIDPGRGAPLVELDGSGEGGTVVAAGGAGRERWVYIGLEPDGSDVVLRVAYPVLVANALAWLGGASATVIADTPPVTEARLPVAETEGPTLAAPVGWGIPSLPMWLGVLAALLLAFEGLAYQRRWVR